MYRKFETSLDGYLAGIFIEKLCEAATAAGFQESLRIAEPAVVEYQKGSEQLALRMGHSGSHKRWVEVESESTDIVPIVRTAAKAAVIDVSDQLLGSLPSVDRPAIRRAIEACLAGLPI